MCKTLVNNQTLTIRLLSHGFIVRIHSMMPAHLPETFIATIGNPSIEVPFLFLHSEAKTEANV